MAAFDSYAEVGYSMTRGLGLLLLTATAPARLFLDAFDYLAKSAADVPIQLVLYLVVLATYRAYFHPLAKYKGPKLLAISNILPIRYALKGEWVHRVLALHEQYGPVGQPAMSFSIADHATQVVRVAPNEISYVTEEAWNDIYKTPKGQQQLKKYIPRSLQSQQGLFDNADDDVHGNIRKVLSPLMNEKGVRERESTLKKQVGLFLDVLGTYVEKNKVVDINKAFQCVTSDISGDLLMGEPFGSLKTGTPTPIVAENFHDLKGLAIGAAFNRNFFLRKFLVERHKPSPRLRKVYGAKAIDQARLGGEAESLHFANPLSEHLDHSLAEKVAVDLITAGSDTVAVLLSGITYLLLRSPSKLAKLITEIRSTFSSLDQITLSSVNSLKYQNAVVQEGLRLWPPGPETMRRVTTADGNTINGERIPPGMLVGVYHWVAGRYSQAWTEADKFLPERWLHEDERYAEDQRGVINPFQIGPRNCVGQRVALAETRLILASMLWSFDLKSDGPLDPKWMDVPIFGLVAEKKPLPVKFQRANRE